MRENRSALWAYFPKRKGASLSFKKQMGKIKTVDIPLALSDQSSLTATPNRMEKKITPVPVSREEKEARLNQRAKAIWLYGLSGAGKTTLATALEARLAADGFKTVLLDGDAIRSGLNRGLGFTEADRTENIRRAAEVARLFVGAGIIPICAFITPLKSHRDLIRKIIGPADLLDVYLAASYATCAERDPKGLYRQAERHQVTQFTGRDSAFEPPDAPAPSLILETGSVAPAVCLERLYDFVVAGTNGVGRLSPLS